MKDFSPHAILRSPLTSDEEAEQLLQNSLTSLSGEGPVVLLIEPPLETQKVEASLQDSWPVFEKPAKE